MGLKPGSGCNGLKLNDSSVQRLGTVDIKGSADPARQRFEVDAFQERFRHGQIPIAQ